MSGPARILLVSDPGVPTDRARRYAEDIGRALNRATSRVVEIRRATHLIPVTEDNSISLDWDESLRREPEDGQEGEILVLLTEMPLHRGGRPVVAQRLWQERTVAISCPALGAIRARRRLVEVLVQTVAPLLGGTVRTSTIWRSQRWNAWGRGAGDRTRLVEAPRTAADAESVVASSQEARASTPSYLFAHTLTAVPRTVTGMVATNRPWRTLPRLSGALSAAGAAGAFGVFYSSIWEMAESLSSVRLAAISVLSVLVMVVWLLLRNRLWERPVQEKLSTVTMFYNMSTVLTLLLCVGGLYAGLFLLILGGGAVVISPDFLARQLQGPVSFGSYADIAWLSASMGVVAGGIGSGFDAETDVRRLTHGQRERYRRAGAEGQDSEDSGLHAGPSA